MEIFKEIHPLRAFLTRAKKQGKSIGLVPTMGALHQGHLALLEASKRENDVTICTVYVNPTQFNNPLDLKAYPRTLDRDISMLKKVECDVLFSPENDQMYPSDDTIKFDFGYLDKIMEGEFRPGHFSGVALVVTKLLNIVQPHHVYFGQKDWQQVAVIRRLIGEFMMETHLRTVPTVREPDGLAMSSRNLRLSVSQRQKAVILYQSLRWAQEALVNGQSLQEVKAQVHRMFSDDHEVRLEYVELANRLNLKPVNSVEGADQLILCMAAYVGEIRLIDNMFLDLPVK